MADQIKFALTEQDYVDSARDQYRRRLMSPRRAVGPAIFLIFALGLFIYSDSDDTDSAMALVVVYVLLAVAVGFALIVAMYLSVGSHARKLFRQQVIQPESDLSWTDAGLQSANAFSTFAAKWSEFYGWRESGGNFTIFLNEGFFYLIPQRALSTDQAADLEATLIRSGLARR